MTPGRRHWLCAAAATWGLTAASGAFAAPDFIGGLKGMIPGGGFSVSGKAGRFVEQVAKRKLEPAAAGETAALNFSGDSRGEFQTARLRMPETEARIETLLGMIDAKWPYAHPGKIKVHILADGKYGPSALPDGSIVVPIGFLDRARSDDEVMFVLSHEYAHLSLTHFGRGERMRAQHKLLRRVAELYAASVQISEVRAQEAGQQVQFTIADRKRIEAAQTRAVADKEQLDWILNNLVDPAWNRRQEDEADALGLDLARATGYAADDGAGAAFVLISADDADKKSRVAQLQERLAAITTEATAAGSKDAGAGAQFDPGAFFNVISKGLQASLRDTGIHVIQDYLSPKHRPPEVRQKGLTDYVLAAYHGPPPLAELKTTWISQTQKSKEFIAAKTAVHALQTAQNFRHDGNYPEAERAIKQALATPYGGLPLFANEAGRIYLAKGDRKTAELQFTKADSHAEQTLDGFSDHVRMEMQAPAFPRALQIIDIYKSRSKTDKDFLPEIVRIYFKMRQNDQALAALQRCLDYDEPNLRDRCAFAAYGPDNADFDKLPEAAQEKVRAATSKAANKASIGSGLGDLIKSLEHTEAN